MIAVSNGWLAAQSETLQPETFVEITSVVTEPGLQEDAVVTSTDEAVFSDTASIVFENRYERTPYRTLEYGQWGLDGSITHFLEDVENQGYVSNTYSNENGYFAQNPVIRINFSRIHSDLIPGITITWSEAFDEWASDFKVTAYNSDGIVAQATVVGNTDVKSIVWFDLIGYSRIEIEIIKWCLPHHRVRCDYVSLGVERTYTKDDLLGFEYSQLVDLLSAELPSSSVMFRLRNDDNQWNPDSPQNIEKYLLEEQKVRVRYGMDIEGKTEWISGGTFWLSEWNTPANGLEASFTASDIFSFMTDPFNDPFEGNLYDLAELVFGYVKLTTPVRSGLVYHIDESLKEIEVKPIEANSGYTMAEMLQLVAHAGRCVLYQDREGVIHIEPRSTTYSGYKIDPFVSYTHPEYTIGKPLRAVAVSYGEDQKLQVEVDIRGEVQTIDNPLIATEADARAVAETARDVLTNRKVISGDFRSDLRLDALDNIIVASKYAANVIHVTEVRLSTTGGGFRGTYVGRVGSTTLDTVKRYSGEFYLNEI